MPCPYFSPERPLESETWLVPPRFPLGMAYQGMCEAVAGSTFAPPLDHQERICNFGYAASFPSGCDRCPADAPADAVRFAWAPVMKSRKTSDLVQIVYVLEKDHVPVAHGVLEYSRRNATFAANGCSSAVLVQAGKFILQR